MANKFWTWTAYCFVAGCAIYYITRAIMELIAPNAANVDFVVYFRAANALASGNHIYAPSVPCCFNYAAMQNNYTYPPLMAMLLRPVVAMGLDNAARAWLVISHLALLGSALIWWKLIGRLVTRNTFLVLLGIAFAFGPMLLGLYGIQVANVLLFIYSLAALAFVKGQSRILGATLAAGAALKVAPIFLLASLLGERRRFAIRTVLSSVAVGAALFALMWIFVPETVDYLRVLPQFLGGVIAPYDHSLTGVVLQTLNSAGIHPSSAINPIMDLIALCLFATTLYICWGAHNQQQRMVAFAAFLALLPIIQGVTWDHHLVNELLVLVLLAPSLQKWSAPWWLAVASVPFLTVYLQPVLTWAGEHGFSPPRGWGWIVYLAIISISLVGMVLLWLATLLSQHRLRETKRVVVQNDIHEDSQPQATLATA